MFKVPRGVAAIAETDWQRSTTTPPTAKPRSPRRHGGRRLVVRRTRLVGPQAELWPDWRHFAFITNRTEPLETSRGRAPRARCRRARDRDLKDQALAHFPSGTFNANSAWTVIGALAHNLLRWTQLLGLPGTHDPRRPHPPSPPAPRPRQAHPHGRQWTLHLPARWPWQDDYINALNRIRALPAA